MKYNLFNCEQYRLTKNGVSIDVFETLQNMYLKSETDALLDSIEDEIDELRTMYVFKDFLIKLYLEYYPEYKYMGFEALEDCEFTMDRSLQYSLDEGSTWNNLLANSLTPIVHAGEKIYFKGTLNERPGTGIGTFSATGEHNVFGNVLSLVYGDNAFDVTDISDHSRLFYSLFDGDTLLVSAENLLLTPKVLCTSCYSYMFNGCTSLTTAPSIIPVNANASCSYMFNECTSLTTAPELPSTTLNTTCYSFMFRNCTSLTTAPELPAKTLMDGCYRSMFSGCTSLNYIKAMFTTEPSDVYTPSWVANVASTGTFVKNSEAEWNVTGDNGIPSGWTVETETA